MGRYFYTCDHSISSEHTDLIKRLAEESDSSALGFWESERFSHTLLSTNNWLIKYRNGVCPLPLVYSFSFKF